jgi:hypothetical protein
MCRTSLIPHHNSTLFPLHPAVKVQATDVVLEKRQQMVRLLRQKALYLPSNSWIDKQRRLSSDGVFYDERMRGVDGFC